MTRAISIFLNSNFLYTLTILGSLWSLALHDTLGKRVKSMDIGMQEAGLHNTSLEISDLSNGAYVYVVESEEQRVDGMMIKLR